MGTPNNLCIIQDEDHRYVLALTFAAFVCQANGHMTISGFNGEDDTVGVRGTDAEGTDAGDILGSGNTGVAGGTIGGYPTVGCGQVIDANNQTYNYDTVRNVRAEVDSDNTIYVSIMASHEGGNISVTYMSGSNPVFDGPMDGDAVGVELVVANGTAGGTVYEYPVSGMDFDAGNGTLQVVFRPPNHPNGPTNYYVQCIDVMMMDGSSASFLSASVAVVAFFAAVVALFA